MGFCVLAADPISEDPRFGADRSSYGEVTYAGRMSNDTAVVPVALLEIKVTDRITQRGEEASG
jgi:hypothetical protein